MSEANKALGSSPPTAPGVPNRRGPEPWVTGLGVAAARGNEQATRTLVAQLTPVVLGAVRSILGPQHPDTNDVVTRALRAFEEALPDFRGECDPCTYALTIATYAALGARRRASIANTRSDSASHSADTPTPIGHEQPDHHLPSLVRRMLDTLPPEQSETLCLHVVLGVPLKEAARSLGVSPSTLHSQLQAMGRALGQAIAAETEPERVGTPLRDDATSQLLLKACDGFRRERASWEPDPDGAIPADLGSTSARERPGSLAPVAAPINRTGWGSPRPPPTQPDRQPRTLTAAFLGSLAMGAAAAAFGWLATGWYQTGGTPHGAGTAALVSSRHPRQSPEARSAAQSTMDISAASTPTQTGTSGDSLEPGSAVRAPPRSTLEQPKETIAGLFARTTQQNGPAARLFDRATQARVQSNYGEALERYRELERNHPTSSESLASRAAVARLLLDTGHPDAALADLDKYLGHRPAALTEEAMVTRALAYQRTGRLAEERGAWEALLRAYPGSLHATRAQSRLRELGPRTRG